ncbi:NAD(P)-dependent dehydrogenase (short-subunit alcohol dehydrogenase family) [Bradyrhizobium sp. LB8.2]
MDIADAQSVAALLETAERHVGGVDLVNNASDMHLTPRHRAILDLDLAVSDQTMATNLRGTLLCCRQAISLAAVARSSTSGRARRSAVTPRRRPTPRRRRG